MVAISNVCNPPPPPMHNILDYIVSRENHTVDRNTKTFELASGVVQLYLMTTCMNHLYDAIN